VVGVVVANDQEKLSRSVDEIATRITLERGLTEQSTLVNFPQAIPTTLAATR
jgi:hypothetical protein